MYIEKHFKLEWWLPEVEVWVIVLLSFHGLKSDVGAVSSGDRPGWSFCYTPLLHYPPHVFDVSLKQVLPVVSFPSKAIRKEVLMLSCVSSDTW